MKSQKDIDRISKFLSLVLRHQPGSIDIHLDENGWTDVDTLLSRMNREGFTVDKTLLEHVVSTNDKKRFAFNDNHTRIRASQGHSIRVDLGYQPAPPPDVLYHGTARSALESIQHTGLDKRQRHHVHLTEKESTARGVGARYGDPVILKIDASAMHADGYEFFKSENQVWLTDHVPVKYIAVEEEQ